MSGKQIYFRVLVNLVLTIVMFILALILIPKLISFFFPFVLAFFLSLIANPVVRFMEKRIRIKRRIGSILLIILVLAILLGGLYLLISSIIMQIISLIEDIPKMISQITLSIEHLQVWFSGITEKPPFDVEKILEDFQINIQEWLSVFLSSIEIPSFSEAGNYLKLFGDLIFIVFITILATYFMMAEREKIMDRARKILPESICHGYQLILSNFKKAVGGYFKAQLKIMVILIVIMYVTFLFIGIKYSFLLAFIVGFIDLLPIFGTGIVFWPWAIIDFFTEDYNRAITILFLYFVCQVIKQLLQPKIVGNSIGISPFLALLFMFIGYRIAGVIGLILGIPFGMVAISFYRLGMFDRIIRGFQILFRGINDYRKY